MKSLVPLLALALLGAAAPTHSQQSPPVIDKYGGLSDFIFLMRRAPGSLGVEPAVLPGRRLAIFAWFRDSESANAFIGSAGCQAMRQIAQAPDSPLPTIPVIKGPVLLVASFTASTKPDAPMLLDQIAVERMLPLPGGFVYGGRFAPKDIELAGLHVLPQLPEVTELTAPKKSKDCVQVDTMQSESGKRVIVAWFTSKKAAVEWYESTSYSKLVKAPLAEIPDSTYPVAAFISITPARPDSQLALEFYTTAAGGFSRGGRFRPRLPLR